MKKTACAFFAALLFFLPAFPAFAANQAPRLVDGADLLSDGEETVLLEKLDEISERQRADIVIVTADSLEGKSPMEYADDFYDENGYGFGDERDGILFLVSMEERDWYISTTGYGITAFTDAGLAYISDQCVGSLSDGDYAAAFTDFAGLCDDFITQARTGKPYDTGFLPKGPFWLFGSLAVSFGIGFVLALVVTQVMKGKLKAARGQKAADSYIKDMRLANQKDLFLYSHVDRRPKPQNNPSSSPGGSRTHVSSSGARHGGRGGKF